MKRLAFILWCGWLAAGLVGCSKGGAGDDFDYPTDADSAQWVYGLRVGDAWLAHTAHTAGRDSICGHWYTRLEFQPGQRTLYIRTTNGIVWARADARCETPDVLVMDANAQVGDTLRLAHNLLQNNNPPVYVPYYVVKTDTVPSTWGQCRRIWMVYEMCPTPPARRRHRRRHPQTDTAIWVQGTGFVRPYPFPYANGYCAGTGSEFCFHSLTQWFHYTDYDSISPDSLAPRPITRYDTLWHNPDCTPQPDSPFAEDATGLTLRAVPNPARGRTRLEINSPRAGGATLRIAALDGQTYPDRHLNLSVGPNSVEVDLPGSGLFLVSVAFRRQDPVVIRVVGL